ncbi:hypothetical protein T265_07969 [Opisthorchis viverrini]|uniref:Uncharacterized protein n=1 Tax=Opisthorchis viverrini TaxID=6198 RepID=A0A074ZAL2_OPIVI|nr:hypothetical protein T265_07969 [Opisthorchis viverrini]KER24326.1 hypothetical protein T265_07969 [Opisthorchis viverrini]
MKLNQANNFWTHRLITLGSVEKKQHPLDNLGEQIRRITLHKIKTRICACSENLTMLGAECLQIPKHPTAHILLVFMEETTPSFQSSATTIKPNTGLLWAFPNFFAPNGSGTYEHRNHVWKELTTVSVSERFCEKSVTTVSSSTTAYPIAANGRHVDHKTSSLANLACPIWAPQFKEMGMETPKTKEHYRAIASRTRVCCGPSPTSLRQTALVLMSTEIVFGRSPGDTIGRFNSQSPSLGARQSLINAKVIMATNYLQFRSDPVLVEVDIPKFSQMKFYKHRFHQKVFYNRFSCPTSFSVVTRIPRASVHRVMRRHLHLCPYHFTLLQNTTEQDKEQRVTFANWLLDNEEVQQSSPVEQ